jgi:V-type H+-transporting ATPase subunit G
MPVSALPMDLLLTPSWSWTTSKWLIYHLPLASSWSVRPQSLEYYSHVSRLLILRVFKLCSTPRRKPPRWCSNQDNVCLNSLLHTARLRGFVIIDRTQKLKDARSEAARDLEAYKARKEADLKEFEAKVRHYLNQRSSSDPSILQHEGVTKANQANIDRETEGKLATLEASYRQNKDKVVKKLLDRVLLVKTELHPNLKKV